MVCRTLRRKQAIKRKKKKKLLITFKALFQARQVTCFYSEGHKITYQMYKRDEIPHHKSAQRKAVYQESFVLENSEVKHWRLLTYGFFHFLHLFTSLTGHFIQQGPNGAQTQYASKHPRCVGPSQIVDCKLHEGTHCYRAHATPSRYDTVCKTDSPTEIETKKKNLNKFSNKVTN